MERKELLQNVTERARIWLGDGFDEQTRDQVKALLEGPEDDLINSFYQDLEFGTGGLRGIMGVGTNRMNEYTVSMATQGLANYLNKQFPHLNQIKVAIAYDCRNNSRFFSETAARIFTANGIEVLLFDELRPTPALSFAIREYGCQSGLVITASHNPKEYNGYKVYWEDGGQIVAPHDRNIIAQVQQIKSLDQVKREGDDSKIKTLGEETDQVYLNRVKQLSLSPDSIKRREDLKIVFTPIHGAAVKLVPQALKMYGFKNIINIPEQDITDGSFPTVVSPNPEEAAALKMALDKARETDADLVMGTDPDGDRVGVAVKNNKGEFVLLNGNQTASLLLYYLLHKWKEKNLLKGNEYIVKTIVTTELLANIASKHGVECFDVLTGFKFIADIMGKNEGTKTFIAGFEESYGYLVGDFVRDKDAVISCALIAEALAWSLDQGKTMFGLLEEMYCEFGFYRESLVSIVRKGKSGADEITSMMDRFRSSPPSTLGGSRVMLVNDYLKQKSYDSINELRRDIDLPKSNVLQFFLKDGSVISIRPSGTEPKIKFYASVRAPFSKEDDYDKVDEQLVAKINGMIDELGVN